MEGLTPLLLFNGITILMVGGIVIYTFISELLRDTKQLREDLSEERQARWGSESDLRKERWESERKSREDLSEERQARWDSERKLRKERWESERKLRKELGERCGAPSRGLGEGWSESGDVRERLARLERQVARLEKQAENEAAPSAVLVGSAAGEVEG